MDKIKQRVDAGMLAAMRGDGYAEVPFDAERELDAALEYGRTQYPSTSFGRLTAASGRRRLTVTMTDEEGA